ncbi:helix-turn-helix domain-containing protein [Williamsia sp. D3]|uniref:helix-turn-helix domain-containing protein n=1 Tax=Williamsia sp. D3 TaxID=1313067 RepID=UPI001267B4AF|nr:helix-turn-helix domain-containing protein [Williamsia sp. D3]
MQEQSVPSTVELEDGARVESQMQVWQFGDARIFRAEMTGFRLIRTRRQIDAGPGDMLAIAMHERCIGKQEQFGSQVRVSPNELMVMDLNSAYTYELEGGGASRCLHVPIELLGLRQEMIRSAASRLRASPLYEMVATQLSEMTVKGDVLSTSPAAPVLGESSIELTRTLLVSAYDTEYARDALNELLMPRIRSFVKQHLAERTLNADVIAAAHDISPRQLYRLCAAADLSLEQWIISERMERAREELSRNELRDVPIATVARRCGFTNGSYFSKRFKTMYGLSPRAWRQMSLGERPQDSVSANPPAQPERTNQSN